MPRSCGGSGGMKQKQNKHLLRTGVRPCKYDISSIIPLRGSEGNEKTIGAMPKMWRANISQRECICHRWLYFSFPFRLSAVIYRSENYVS